MSLKPDQKRLYESLQKSARCFVRVCDTDDALWVTDLPRRMTNTDALASALREMGFACTLREETRLWHVDWTEKRWDEMLAGYPYALPAFPADERLHAVYALCRLWMLHPGERSPENLPLIRRVIKLADEPEEKLLAGIAPLHARAAAALRTGRDPAYDAGRILAGWLLERREEK